MSKILSAATLFALALLSFDGAMANVERDYVYKTITPPELVDLFREFGYRAELGTTSSGNPRIRSSTEGANFTVYFYGCNTQTPRVCDSIQFAAGWDLPNGTTLTVVNDWNREKRFGTAYLDEQNDPWLEMNINIDGGVTKDNLRDWLRWWDTAVGEFKRHIQQ